MSTELNQIYKCEICGNIVEVLHTGAGELVCCGQPMKLQEEQTGGEYAEKHAPVVEESDKGIKVQVGAVQHPMEEKHYIEWIEVITEDGRVAKKFLKPGDVPEAGFCKKGTARMYCNVHGLWKNNYL